MPINKNELTKEQIAKAMSCETVEELMELAKASGDRRLGTGQRRAEKCGGRLQALLYKTLLYKKYKTERVIFNRCVST